jgi:IS5 family transposase
VNKKEHASRSKREKRVWKSEYAKNFPHGDRLNRVARLIDWNAFRPILEPLFKNTEEGRPHTDVVLMTKVLVLQSWYGLADEMVEEECRDRLKFQNFLGYPSSVPDAKTIWLFKERIAKEDVKERELWAELQSQLGRYRVAVKKGQMKDAVLIELGGLRAEGQHGPVVEVAPHTGHAQDSTMIEADPGAPTEEDVKRMKEIEEKRRKKNQNEQKAEADPGRRNGAAPPPPPPPAAPRNDTTTSTNTPAASPMKDGGVAAALPPSTVQPATLPAPASAAVKTKPRGEKARTTRSRDGTWTKKRGRSFFGYKLHTKDDLSSVFIEDFEVTTASVHDNNIDLTKKGEVCVRDRAYTGGRGSCVNMIRATRGHPLTEEEKKLNRFLSKVRAPVEHPHAVIKRVFHGGRVLVTTLGRVKVRMTFVCTCYNLFRALTLAG